MNWCPSRKPSWRRCRVRPAGGGRGSAASLRPSQPEQRHPHLNRARGRGLFGCHCKRSDQSASARTVAWKAVHGEAVGCGNVGSYHTTPLPSPHGACTMTTHLTQVTNAAGPIVALDLGKYKSVACIYRAPHDRQFTTLPTSQAELTRLLARHQPAVVLIE